MVDQLALASFTTPAAAAAGTKLDVTSVDITETCKAAILLYGGDTTDGSNVEPGRMGIGLISTEGGTSAGGGCATPLARNGLATPDNRTGGAGNGTVIAVNQDTAFGTNFDVRMRVDPTAPQIAGGTRLEVVLAATTGQAKGKALLFAGADMRSHAFAGTATTTLTSEVCNGNGGGGAEFVPDILVVLFADLLPTGTPGAIDDAIASLGFVVNDGSASQVCAFVNIDDATNPTDADGRLDSTHGAACLRNAARGTLVTVTFAFTANGFSYQTSSDSCRIIVLAIKFGSPFRAAAKQLAVTSSTGRQHWPDFGFTPAVVLGHASLIAALDTTTDGPTASSAGYFMTGSRGSRAASIHAEEGITTSAGSPTNAHLYQSDDALVLLDETGAIAMQASYRVEPGFGLEFTAAAAGYLTALGLALNWETPRPQGQRRARAVRQARMTRRRRPLLVQGVPVGPPPLTRLLQSIARMRRRARARLFQRPRLTFGTTEPARIEIEESKGRISWPGVTRGVVRSPGSPQDERVP